MPGMMDALVRLMPRRAMTRAEEKASRTGPLIAIETLGRPVWTPRDYATFAREGFMQNPIVYRAVRMVAEAAASIPLLLYEGADEHDGHPLLDLLAQPSADQTGTDFFEAWYGYLLVSGNAYAEAVAIGGQVRELHALRPDRMKVIPGVEGWPEAYDYTAGGQTVRFDTEAAPGVRPILHVRMFHPVNDHYGMSPIEAAATAIDIHNTASRWNKALLDNSARPSGALVYGAGDARMTAEQFDRLKSELETTFQGAKHAGRPLLLEGGLDWKPLSLSPKDMDFIEAKNAAAREIALALGVPPMLLGIPGDNTYSNYQEAQRAFWRQTVLPLVNRTAKAMSAWLGRSYGETLTLKPDTDQVEALSSEREALWARLNSISFLTVDEKRAAVGYGPVGDAGSDPAQGPFDDSTVKRVRGLTPSLKYRPDQARAPAGTSNGGQWVDEGFSDRDSDGGSDDSTGRKIGDEIVVAARASGPKILGRGSKDFGQRVNTPSAKDIQIRMDHIIRGHTVTGSAYRTSKRDGGNKSAFPENMTPKDIEKAVREAYSKSREVSSPQFNPDGMVRLLEGEAQGLTIRMYFNATTKSIDSAFTR